MLLATQTLYFQQKEQDGNIPGAVMHKWLLVILYLDAQAGCDK